MAEWQIGLALVAVAALAGLASRWWHLRQVKALQQHMLKLEASLQTAAKSSAQARKQVEDLQRLVAGYRRRIATGEPRRRTRVPVVTEVIALDTTAPAGCVPNGWADTQPM